MTKKTRPMININIDNKILNFCESPAWAIQIVCKEVELKKRV